MYAKWFGGEMADSKSILVHNATTCFFMVCRQSSLRRVQGI
jgi:hypothetical protein